MNIQEHSDAFLSILDHLVFQAASFDDLYYGLCLTSKHGLKLNKLELLMCLEHGVEQGAIEAFLDKGHGHYRITETGLQIWQQERKPDWNRFIRYQSRFDKQSLRETWQLMAKSKEVILDFIEIHQSVGLMGKGEIKLNAETIELTRHKQVKGYRCQFEFRHLGQAVANRHLEAKRNWWSNAPEMNSL